MIFTKNFLKDRILVIFGLLRATSRTRNDGVERFYFLRKQKVAKTFDLLWLTRRFIFAWIVSCCRTRNDKKAWIAFDFALPNLAMTR